MTWSAAACFEIGTHGIRRALALALIAAQFASGPKASAQVSDEELFRVPEKLRGDPAQRTSLSLKLAREKALKANLPFRQAHIDLELAELAHKTAFHTMFLPNLSLDASVAGNYTYGRLNTSRTNEVKTTADQNGYPSSIYMLSLGEYVLYNGGKDSLAYRKAVIDWNRARQIYRDRERETGLNAISQFARYQTDGEKVDAAVRYLTLSISLARLIKTRVRQGKATRDEYSSALNDILEARNNLEQARVVAEASLWKLNTVVGDAVGQEYRLESTVVEFRPLKIGVREAAVLYQINTPTLLEQKANLERRRLELELAQRERLPTPRVVLSPLRLSFANAYGSTGYTSSGGLTTDAAASNHNLDVGFSVALSIPLFTESGSFRSRTVAAAELLAAREELQSQIEVQTGDTQIRQFVQQIALQESLVKNSQQLLKNSVELLDGLFARLSGPRSAGLSRLELRDSLRSSFQAELEYREALLQHLALKFELAKFLGVDLDENVDL